MKYILIFLVLFSSDFLAQSNSFLWLISPEIQTDENYESQIKRLAAEKNIDAVFITGNLTKNGFLNEFKILDKMIKSANLPTFILPSENDLFSTSQFELNFYEYFDELQFGFSSSNLNFVGLQSAICNSSEIGMISPYFSNWFTDEFQSKSDSNYFFAFSNNEPFEILNFASFHNHLQNSFFPIIFLPKIPKEVSQEFYFVYPPNSESVLFLNFSENHLQVTNQQNVELFSFDFEKMNLVGKNESKIELKIVPKIAKVNWSQNIGSPISNSPISNSQNTFCVTDDGLLYSIENDGTIFWEFDLFADFAKSPILNDGILVLASIQGDLFTINSANGEQIQTLNTENTIITDLKTFDYKWELNTMSPKTSGSKAAVVFGTENSKYFCYDLETLEQIWEFQFEESAFSSPVLLDDKLIFQLGNSVKAISLKDGRLIWSWETANLLENEIFSNSKNAFVSDGINLFSIDLQLGKENWRIKIPNSAIYFSKNLGISVLETNGKLTFINENDGKFRSALKLQIDNRFNSIKFAANQNNLFLINGTKIHKISKNFKISTIAESSNSPFSGISFSENQSIILTDFVGNIYKITLLEK